MVLLLVRDKPLLANIRKIGNNAKQKRAKKKGMWTPA